MLENESTGPRDLLWPGVIDMRRNKVWPVFPHFNVSRQNKIIDNWYNFIWLFKLGMLENESTGPRHPLWPGVIDMRRNKVWPVFPTVLCLKEEKNLIATIPYDTDRLSHCEKNNRLVLVNHYDLLSYTWAETK